MLLPNPRLAAPDSRVHLLDLRSLGFNPQDSVSVENSLYADPRVHEAAAVGVPDERLGELVAAVVSIKPRFQASTTENALVAQVRTRCVAALNFARRPPFNLPLMVFPRQRLHLAHRGTAARFRSPFLSHIVSVHFYGWAEF
jgi:acyl-CoA synthetase (AMP-forming)/AMP-acid ligase II